MSGSPTPESSDALITRLDTLVAEFVRAETEGPRLRTGPIMDGPAVGDAHLPFVAGHADLVAVSFVRSAADVEHVLDSLHVTGPARRRSGTHPEDRNPAGLAPSMLLGPDTTWSEVDDGALDVTLTDAGHTVTGRVFIDERGAPRLQHHRSLRRAAQRPHTLTMDHADRGLDHLERPTSARRHAGTSARRHVGTSARRHVGTSAVWQFPEGPFPYIVPPSG